MRTVAFVHQQTECLSTTDGWDGELERCYLRYENKALRLDIGRQALDYGVGRIFRPTDFLTPRAIDNHDESRIGRDIVVLRQSTSALTCAEWMAGNDFYGVRVEGLLKETHLRTMLIDREQWGRTLGLDFRGGLKGIYGEARYDWDADFANGKLGWVMEWQKNLTRNQILNLEWFYNENDSASPVAKNGASSATQYTGSHYLASAYQYCLNQVGETVLFCAPRMARN